MSFGVAKTVWNRTSTSVLRSQSRWTLKFSVRGISSEVIQQLKVFPEYKSAAEFEAIGDFSKALPLYERMHDILCGAMGSASPVSADLTIHTAKLHIAAGQFDKAIRTLRSEDLQGHPKSTQLQFSNLLAQTYLLQGDFERANKIAAKAVHLMEEHPDSSDHHDEASELALFSPTYGMLGVTSLYRGDLDTAETYLQLSARWAQQHNPVHQIIALSNLGSFSLFKLGTTEFPVNAEMLAASKGVAHLRRRVNTVASAVNHKPLLEHALVKDALAYWSEALQVVTNAGKADRSSGAAAMCGVSPNTAPDMTGLGGKARVVPGAGSSTGSGAEEATEGTGVSFEHTLENLLHEASCMNAYVHTLANFAELYEVTGNMIEKEEYVSAALAAIQEYERHLAGAGHAPISGADAASVHSLEQLGKHDGGHPSRVAHRPVLGRVLALAAHREMSVGQAVTAEGLYRSALDHLTSPAAIYDPRFKYERGIAMHGYGLLLSSWDKRATAGTEMGQRADDQLASLPEISLPAAVAPDATLRIPLNTMIQWTL